jgi:hypothetical protein
MRFVVPHLGTFAVTFLHPFDVRNSYLNHTSHKHARLIGRPVLFPNNRELSLFSGHECDELGRGFRVHARVHVQYSGQPAQTGGLNSSDAYVDKYFMQ